MVDNRDMETATLKLPETILTGPSAGLKIPAWIKALGPTVARPRDLEKLDRLPELTLVWAGKIQHLLSRRGFLAKLSRRLARTPEPARVVFLFEPASKLKREPIGAEALLRLFNYFDRPADLEIAVGAEAAQNAISEAIAKIVAAKSLEEQARAESDPLAKIKEVIAATKGLRAASGKLAADRVAAQFGLSVSELADLLGKTRQAVSKTPDSDALQPLLRPFERIARLRAVFTEEEFRNWLHLANEELGKRSAAELIRAGEVGLVAELAEDMLTGQPA